MTFGILHPVLSLYSLSRFTFPPSFPHPSHSGFFLFIHSFSFRQFHLFRFSSASSSSSPSFQTIPIIPAHKPSLLSPISHLFPHPTSSLKLFDIPTPSSDHIFPTRYHDSGPCAVLRFLRHLRSTSTFPISISISSISIPTITTIIHHPAIASSSHRSAHPRLLGRHPLPPPLSNLHLLYPTLRQPDTIIHVSYPSGSAPFKVFLFLPIFCQPSASSYAQKSSRATHPFPDLDSLGFSVLRFTLGNSSKIRNSQQPTPSQVLDGPTTFHGLIYLSTRPEFRFHCATPPET